jgi:hypothetical protein
MTPSGNDGAFKAGTPDDFGGSLAEAIERAFEETWVRMKDRELPDRGRDDRRMLFVGVAQGVVRYLKDHAESGFDVDVEVAQKDSLVESEGTASPGSSGSGTWDVEVTQTSDGSGDEPETPVRSEGEGTVAINTEGELYPLTDDGGESS